MQRLLVSNRCSRTGLKLIYQKLDLLRSDPSGGDTNSFVKSGEIWGENKEKESKKENLQKKLKLKLTFQLDLLLKDANGGDTTSFVKNGEWDLIGFYNDASYILMTMIIIIIIKQ